MDRRQTKAYEKTLDLRSGAFIASGNSNYFQDHFFSNIFEVPLIFKNEVVTRPT
ncbi:MULTISPECIES: Pesticidal crystal protein cry2Ad [Bacillus cereus group]|uniref:Pesticidal crystal protein cry2Ad n=1 Tax=Bacillus cereus group TaxID=86661 RepID=UPI0001A1E0B6|nr:Pesticidal crystal protein cry2Ad [Bacillus thuringiensis]MCU5280562.1 hypothetical protein [Bacillus cereus]OTZ30768.1 hypothetical protein BK763_19285 [Bacillus thuringiensis serovar thompsoni]OTZ54215.1 hypothetical protein BK762_08510 [Bacillus thuringiensis serovar toumanoffi]EEM93050.1 Pesticidal crystal protein cry2Ad [Bacillus thuringiensis IBL 200]MCR6869583.1 hypothetical protein [Bacillus thuringiensis]